MTHKYNLSRICFQINSSPGTYRQVNKFPLLSTLQTVPKRCFWKKKKRALLIPKRSGDQTVSAVDARPSHFENVKANSKLAGATARIATKLNRVSSTSLTHVPHPSILSIEPPSSFSLSLSRFFSIYLSLFLVPANLRIPYFLYASPSLSPDSPAGERLKQMSGQRRP